MHGTNPSRSWQASPGALRTCALAGVVLVSALVVAEIGARYRPLRAVLKAPSLGSSSRRFEMQFNSLERYAASAGTVDCIVMGNSTALMGVDPNALTRGYEERTGHELRCFNFGVSGMTASAVGGIAPILVTLYRPWLLIYVISARDVGANVDGPLLAETPWVQYRQGRFSLEGWLVEHSAAFRYFLLYRQWLDPMRWPAAASSSGTTAEGFFPVQTHLLLSPGLWERARDAYASRLSQAPSDTELAGLSRLLGLAGAGTQIVVIEAPVHERLRRWGQRASRFSADALVALRHAARQRRVMFRRVPTWDVVQADGWADLVHLNTRGAARFSEWVGARVGAAVQAGRLKAPRSATRPLAVARG